MVPKREWKPKVEMRTPRYITPFGDLPVAHANS
ncbi:DUF4113 domain-containing protein [Methylobacterium sp. J-001]